jgi:hypothetical protein
MRFVLQRQIVVAATVLIAGLLQAMDQNDIRKKWKWAHNDGLLFWTAVVATGLVVLNSIGDVIVQRRALAGEGRRLDIHKPVIAALVAVAADTGINITDLGANVFVVKKGIGYRLGYKEWTVRTKTWRIGRKPRLERAERIRLSDYPAMSDVPWTEGRGVIGDCWARARPEYVHWAPLAKRWSGKDITEAQWARIKPEDKAGFTREQFMMMVWKYAEILAVPIQDDGKVVGVVAVDRVWRADGRQDSLLNITKVEDTVTSMAAVLQNVLAGR